MLRLRVKEVAAEKGISRRQLSKKADIAYNTLRTIYRDPYRRMTTTVINKLAKALDVPVTELIEDVSEDFARAEQEQMGKEEEEDD